MECPDIGKVNPQCFVFSFVSSVDLPYSLSLFLHISLFYFSLFIEFFLWSIKKIMSFFSKGKQTEYSRLLFTYIIPAMVQGMSILKFAVLRYGSEVLFYASWYIAKLNNKTLGVCFIFMSNWAMKLTFIAFKSKFWVMFLILIYILLYSIMAINAVLSYAK